MPYYPPHPITERLALTVFPQVRPIHVVPPPAGVSTSVLAASSQDSYRRPPSAAGDAVSGRSRSAPDVEDRGAQALAVALEGVWPGASPDKHFRLVVAGTSKFATNEYFPYVSDGELSVAMVRWLAADDATPGVTPQTYDLPEIVLTSRQMRDDVHRAGAVAAAVDDAVRSADVVEAALSAAAARHGTRCASQRRSRPRCCSRFSQRSRQRAMARTAQQRFRSRPRGWSRSRRPKSIAGRNSRRAGQRRAPPRSRAAGRSMARPAPCRPSLPRISTPALRLLHVSEPAREIAAGELTAGSFAEFGLDPPASVVALDTPGRRVGDGEFRHAQSGRHVAICPAWRRADGLSDAAACRRRVAGGGRHGAPAARAGRACRREPRHEPVACRFRWRRCGRSRSCSPASSPASSAMAPAIGSGMSASMRTPPAATPTSPIRRRPA